MTDTAKRQEVALHRGRVVESFKALIGDTEDLLRATASLTGSEIDDARTKLKARLEQAKETAHGWEGSARERSLQAYAAADEYVHENTWKSIGIAGLVGVLFGCCISSGSRRDDRDHDRR